MPRKLLPLALGLPLVVLLLGIVQAEHHLSRSERWTFEITGYDPRDLLRGHYLQYRIELHESEPLAACEEDTHERCCLCLTRQGAGQPPKVQRATCELARSRCDGHLETRYLPELQRYYIPEERAVELTERLQKAAAERGARLVVAIDGAGKPQIDTLLVNGRPLLERPR